MTGLFAFFIIFIPPLLFASTNIIDKFLTVGDEDDSTPAALLLIGGFFNILAACALGGYVLITSTLVISWPLVLNGFLFTGAIFLYFHVLKSTETDRVIIWYQSIPIFGLVGGAIFLSEFPSALQIMSILLIIIGGAVISYTKGKLDAKFMVIMLISSFLLACNDVVFAEFGRQTNFSNALVSDFLGKAVWSVPLLLFPYARRGFIQGLRTKFSVQAVNEIIFIIGDAILDVAKLVAPIAIVQSAAGTQPAFVFLGVLVLNKYFPHILKEEKTGKIRLKIVSLVIVVIGGILLTL